MGQNDKILIPDHEITHLVLLKSPFLSHLLNINHIFFHWNHHFPIGFPACFSAETHRIVAGAHPLRIARTSIVWPCGGSWRQAIGRHRGKPWGWKISQIWNRMDEASIESGIYNHYNLVGVNDQFGSVNGPFMQDKHDDLPMKKWCFSMTTLNMWFGAFQK